MLEKYENARFYFKNGKGVISRDELKRDIAHEVVTKGYMILNLQSNSSAKTGLAWIQIERLSDLTTTASYSITLMMKNDNIILGCFAEYVDVVNVIFAFLERARQFDSINMKSLFLLFGTHETTTLESEE